MTKVNVEQKSDQEKEIVVNGGIAFKVRLHVSSIRIVVRIKRMRWITKLVHPKLTEKKNELQFVIS